MPIHKSKDKLGYYLQYGKTGKKYYFNPKDPTSGMIASMKVLKQERAIRASQARAGKPIK